ncbi:MAG: hypothetical protein Q9227_006970 [Pyrenula ochraceoflavens]
MMVYKLLLILRGRDEYIFWLRHEDALHKRQSHPTPQEPAILPVAILRTCRAVYREASEVLYRENVLGINIHTDGTDPMGLVSPESAKLVRCLHVDGHGPEDQYFVQHMSCVTDHFPNLETLYYDAVYPDPWAMFRLAAKLASGARPQQVPPGPSGERQPRPELRFSDYTQRDERDEGEVYTDGWLDRLEREVQEMRDDILPNIKFMRFENCILQRYELKALLQLSRDGYFFRWTHDADASYIGGGEREFEVVGKEGEGKGRTEIDFDNPPSESDDDDDDDDDDEDDDEDGNDGSDPEGDRYRRMANAFSRLAAMKPAERQAARDTFFQQGSGLN